MTKVNIYYGGRGLIEDPTIYVMNKISEVLEELNISVKRYNLYEDKRGISVLPKTLKDADAVILAASVEWFGIGGLLQQFLDACWLYGDKSAISKLYMMPVVISTTYGERDALFHLMKAWDLLGGILCDGISCYAENHVDFETNTDYAYFIEKRTENFYRSFTKKLCTLPSSNNAVRETVLKPKSINLTPQESEQLSMYVSDDSYVKKQKEDIQELSEMFRNLLGDDAPDVKKDPYIEKFQNHFHPVPDLALSYSIELSDQHRTLVLDIDGQNLNCYYGEKEDANVAIKTKHALLDSILSGQTTLQSAFMSGELTCKGDFKILRTFDTLFQFK